MRGIRASYPLLAGLIVLFAAGTGRAEDPRPANRPPPPREVYLELSGVT
ncbi:MAG: hypothetical protein ACYTG6_04355 [Planctomycetota bacterium]|jgi:hypothetical protein